MTEPAGPTDEAALPSPAPALRARFEAVLAGPMQGVPMVNPALGVQALGFRPWGEHWLGVLVTPWFMNLVLMPRLAAQWHPLGERETRHHVFPAGVFEFIGAQDAELGNYQACSLFSPMFEFQDDATARATALAALDALFDPQHQAVAEVPPAKAAAPAATPAAAPAKAEPAAPVELSKRSFLFGKPRPTPGS